MGSDHDDGFSDALQGLTQGLRKQKIAEFGAGIGPKGSVSTVFVEEVIEIDLALTMGVTGNIDDAGVVTQQIQQDVPSIGNDPDD
jgi:hypothetical protein